MVSHALFFLQTGEMALMPSAVSFSPELTSVALWLTLGIDSRVIPCNVSGPEEATLERILWDTITLTK